MGYKTFYKNIYVSLYFGIKWRPWGEGAGQPAHGAFQKEFIIVEKKKDGKPLELHTDLTDALTLYRKIRIGIFWVGGGNVRPGAHVIDFYGVDEIRLSGAGCGALRGARILVADAGLKTSQKVRRFKKEAKTNECEAPSMRKKAFMAIAVAAIPVFLALVHAGR